MESGLLGTAGGGAAKILAGTFGVLGVPQEQSEARAMQIRAFSHREMSWVSQTDKRSLGKPDDEATSRERRASRSIVKDNYRDVI